MIDAVEKPYHCFLKPLKEKCFSDTELGCLKQMYNCLYPNSEIKHISRFYYQSKNLSINHEEYISTASRSKRSPVAAHWPGVIGIDLQGEAPMRVGVINSFIRHEITLTTALLYSLSLTCTHRMVHGPPT